MRVWKDNLIDGEMELTPEEISMGFWKSDLGEDVAKGGRLERYLLLYLSDFGTFDVSEQGEEWGEVLTQVLKDWPQSGSEDK